MTDPFVETALFKATGAPTARTMAQHHGDVLNILSFGAVNDGSDAGTGTDNTAAIQRCFNAAFTDAAYPYDTAGTPHGKANSHLNKAVFIPPGYFAISGTLQLNDVHGGLIYGSGLAASNIMNKTIGGSGVSNTGIVVNGMSHTTLRDFNITTPGGNGLAGGVFGIDLDWDGPVGGVPSATNDVGLGNNLFYNMGCGSPNPQSPYDGSAIRIAHSGFEGHCNQFVKCAFGGSPVFLIEGEDAVCNLIQCGAHGGRTIVKCLGGSFTMQSTAMDFHITEDAIYISSPIPCYLEGCRTEQKGASCVVRLLNGAMCTVSTIAGTEPYSGDPPQYFAILDGNSTLINDGNVCPGDITATTGCRLYHRASYHYGDFVPSTLPGGGTPGPSVVLRQYI